MSLRRKVLLVFSLVNLLDTHSALFKGGLTGVWVMQPEGQTVDTIVEVKRDKHHIARYAMCQLSQHHGIPASGNEPHIGLMANTKFFSCVRVDFHIGCWTEFVAVANFSGAGSRVEVLNHTTAIAPERVIVIRFLVIVAEDNRNQVGLAIRGLEFAIGIKSGITL